jgi:hypothetical protein
MLPIFKNELFWAVTVYNFNPSSQEAEAGESLNLRPAWSTKWVPGSQGYTEKPCLKKQTNKQKQKTKNQTKTKQNINKLQIFTKYPNF